MLYPFVAILAIRCPVTCYAATTTGKSTPGSNSVAISFSILFFAFAIVLSFARSIALSMSIPLAFIPGTRLSELGRILC